MIGTIIGTIIAWQALGFIICILLVAYGAKHIEYANGLEFLNPIYIHKQVRVNWFGAIVMTLFYTAICPLAAICYWFYKLCTAGR